MHAFRLAVAAAGLLVVATAPPAIAVDDPAATATYVTGTIVDSFGTPPEPLEGSHADRWVMLTEREVEWSDPRLPSRMVARTFLDSYEGTHPDGSVWPSIGATTYRLEGLDGAWSGVGQGFDVNPEWMPTEPSELMWASMITLTGEDAYDGLSATLLLHVDAHDWGQGSAAFEGFIYQGDPPPVPDPIESGFVLPE